MKGMSRLTGYAITDDESQEYAHLKQSIHDILSTLIGTRLCRRNYGSLVPALIDQPGNDITRLKIMNASATAIIHIANKIIAASASLKEMLDSNRRNYYKWRFGEIFYTKKTSTSSFLNNINIFCK